MKGFLGEKLGEGATADSHVWAPGQIVKLFKAGVSPRLGRHEARMTRAAFAAGAPKVLDEVTLEGRFGIVLQRLDGPTLACLSGKFATEPKNPTVAETQSVIHFVAIIIRDITSLHDGARLPLP